MPRQPAARCRHSRHRRPLPRAAQPPPARSARGAFPPASPALTTLSRHLHRRIRVWRASSRYWAAPQRLRQVAAAVAPVASPKPTTKPRPSCQERRRPSLGTGSSHHRTDLDATARIWSAPTHALSSCVPMSRPSWREQGEEPPPLLAAARLCGGGSGARLGGEGRRRGLFAAASPRDRATGRGGKYLRTNRLINCN